jgi:gas vesicle protein
MSKENEGGDKLVYFLVGAGIGAVTALLFAPKPGSELRAEIADATKRGLDQARDTSRELNERANELYQTGTERANELYQTGVERANDIAARSKDSVSDLTERGKELLNRQKSQIAAALEAGKQGYADAKQSDQGKALAAFEDNA